MIRFFRRIRQNLLGENNTRRYLLYAVGEIVLVVLGIVIALQIDNWNEWRQERELEQLVLEQLQEDYQSNLEQLNQRVYLRRTIIDASYSVLEMTDHPEGVNRDSLIAKLSILLIDPTFDPIENDMSNSGNLRLITNRKLKHLLSNWTSDIVAVQEIEQNWSSIVNSQLQSTLTGLGISRDLAHHFANDMDLDWQLERERNFEKQTIGRSRQGASVEEIARSKELEGLVSYAITYNVGANLESETVVNRIQEILDLIKEEIDE
ncbi:MAG: DUF6090 family protein [Robiginitalea sp.]|jgi:hypothetical protein